MLHRLSLFLFIVGGEEIGLNTEQIPDGTAVTDTIMVYDTLIVNYDL